MQQITVDMQQFTIYNNITNGVRSRLNGIMHTKENCGGKDDERQLFWAFKKGYQTKSRVIHFEHSHVHFDRSVLLRADGGDYFGVQIL